MPTIAENLQTLIDIKAGLKESLTNQGKEPTDAMGTYAGLIDGLENPDDVEYLLTVDGETAVYAQLHGEEKVDLNATANDIREGSIAVVNSGVITGEKFIPSYISRYGYRLVAANAEATITGAATDYKNIMISIAPYSSSTSASTAINYVSVDNATYDVASGSKISDITKDIDNELVSLGITVSEKSIIRYFLVEEEV